MKISLSKQRKQIVAFLKEKGGAVNVNFGQDGAVGCCYSSNGGWYFVGWEDQLIKQLEAFKTDNSKT